MLFKGCYFFFFPSNSIKDKNKDELIPPVMKETVSYLKRKGEFCFKRACIFQNKDNIWIYVYINIYCLVLIQQSLQLHRMCFNPVSSIQW